MSSPYQKVPPKKLAASQNLVNLSTTAPKQGFVNARTGKAWQATRDADMERLLERLDRIARDVELASDAIAERLGVTLADTEEDTDEESDQSEEDGQDQ